MTSQVYASQQFMQGIHDVMLPVNLCSVCIVLYHSCILLCSVFPRIFRILDFVCSLWRDCHTRNS